MKTSLRRSLAARVTAFGFILFILFGNFWAASALIGKDAPAWVQLPFAAGLALSMIGGVWMGIYALGMRFGLWGSEEEEEAIGDAEVSVADNSDR